MTQAAWLRQFVSLDEYLEEMVTHWQYSEKHVVYKVTVRDFWSDWGSAKHISIFKPPHEDDNAFDKEPNMAEKKFVLDGVNKDFSPDEVAFEVFPAREDIVDKFDMYHIWSLRKRDIPFYINFKLPRFILKWKTITINSKNIMYTTRIYYAANRKPIRVYLVREASGTELKWYDKQNFKDVVIGESVVAVEFVTDGTSNIAALICVPKSIRKLPFGLR